MMKNNFMKILASKPMKILASKPMKILASKPNLEAVRRKLSRTTTTTTTLGKTLFSLKKFTTCPNNHVRTIIYQSSNSSIASSPLIITRSNHFSTKSHVKDVMNAKSTKDVINADIPFNEFILILENGENRGKVSKSEALSLVQDAPDSSILLLLVQESPLPVAKIISKTLYKTQQDLKKSSIQEKINNNSKKTKIKEKEIEINSGIGNHDLDIKISKIITFLQKGWPVKLCLMERRQGSVKDLFATVLEKTKEYGKVRDQPQRFERKLLFSLRPLGKE